MGRRNVVDGNGNAYVTGGTSSDQNAFPVISGPGLTYGGGRGDAFAAKVNASGAALVYASYIGGCTTFFKSFSSGCYRFYGTSAAAPHAAGVAALLKQKANQISLPFNFGLAEWPLQSTARPMSGGVPESVGAGLIDALAAMQREIALVRLYLPLVLR